MPRLRQVSRDEATPAVRELYDQWFGPGRDPVAEPGTATGTPGNWWTVHALVPEILDAMRSYSYAQADLDPQLRELALVRTGYVRESRFVYSQHCKAARRMGLTDDKIAEIPFWQISTAYLPVERAVLAYTDGVLLQNGRVHERVFEALREHMDDPNILILNYLVSMYAMHATTCRSLRLEYDDVPDRITEIPAPEAGGVQDWQGEFAPSVGSDD
jgi:alkylhydroperoxidase family enzyme